MIRIKTLEKDFIDNHFNAIKDYFDRSNTSIVNYADYSNIDKWLRNQLKVTFEDVIKANPEILEDLVRRYDSSKQKMKKSNRDKLIKLYGAFASSAGNFFFNNQPEYNGFKLQEKLGLVVCPYCNRNFIHTIGKDKDKKRTSELDHFYPKESYAFLALSIYNLVLSCKVCNQLKKARKEPIPNPYDTRYDFHRDVKIRMKPKNSYFVEDVNAFEIEFEQVINPAQPVYDNQLKIFELQELYKNHKGYVLELIQKNIIYNDSYIDELFKRYEGSFFKNKEDVIRLIASNYITDEDLGKRPLAKLTKDISEGLGLL